MLYFSSLLHWGNDTICSSLDVFASFISHSFIQLLGFLLLMLLLFTLKLWNMRKDQIYLKNNLRNCCVSLFSSGPEHPRPLLSFWLTDPNNPFAFSDLSRCLSPGCLHLESSLYYWCSAAPTGRSSVRGSNIKDECVNSVKRKHECLRERV